MVVDNRLVLDSRLRGNDVLGDFVFAVFIAFKKYFLLADGKYK
jgi:hypothetical protein